VNLKTGRKKRDHLESVGLDYKKHESKSTGKMLSGIHIKRDRLPKMPEGPVFADSFSNLTTDVPVAGTQPGWGHAAGAGRMQCAPTLRFMC